MYFNCRLYTYEKETSYYKNCSTINALLCPSPLHLIAIKNRRKNYAYTTHNDRSWSNVSWIGAREKKMSYH